MTVHSVEIHTIPGRRQSACNNDAYSIVSTQDDGSTQSWGIIPDSELQGKSKSEITATFARAARANGADDETMRDIALAAHVFAHGYVNDGSNYLDDVADVDAGPGDLNPGPYAPRP